MFVSATSPLVLYMGTFVLTLSNTDFFRFIQGGGGTQSARDLFRHNDVIGCHIDFMVTILDFLKNSKIAQN